MVNDRQENWKESYTDFYSASAGIYNRKAVLAFIVPVVLIPIILLPLLAGIIFVRGGGGVAVYQVILITVPIALLIGWSTAGGVLMDSARGIDEKTLRMALFTGSKNALKLFISIILTGMVCLLWGIFVAALLYLCKIPGIGPFLFAVLAPALSVATGFIVIGLLYSWVLIPPAIWATESVVIGLNRFAMIVRTRLPETIMQVSKLYLVTGALIAVVAVLIWVGTMFFNIVSVPVLGSSIGLMKIGLSFLIKSSLSAHDVAGFVGWILLLVMGAVIPITISLMAANLLYLDLLEGLHLPMVGKAASINDLNKTTSAVEQAVDQSDEHTPDSLTGKGSETVSVVLKCPRCGAHIQASDRFCGECGYAVKVND